MRNKCPILHRRRESVREAASPSAGSTLVCVPAPVETSLAGDVNLRPPARSGRESRGWWVQGSSLKAASFAVRATPLKLLSLNIFPALGRFFRHLRLGHVHR